jgi:soluble cytochrome b562
MTRRLTFGVLTLALITALTMSFSGTQQVRAESEHEHHGEHEVLEKSMKIIGSSFKKLRSEARSKAFGESTIMELQKMQTAAIVAMHANAEEKITKKEDVIAYRTQMADLVKKLLDMELAILNDKNDDAAAMVNDLNTIMKAGHNKFRKED